MKNKLFVVIISAVSISCSYSPNKSVVPVTKLNRPMTKDESAWHEYNIQVSAYMRGWADCHEQDVKIVTGKYANLSEDEIRNESIKKIEDFEKSLEQIKTNP